VHSLPPTRATPDRGSATLNLTKRSSKFRGEKFALSPSSVAFRACENLSSRLFYIRVHSLWSHLIALPLYWSYIRRFTHLSSDEAHNCILQAIRALSPVRPLVLQPAHDRNEGFLKWLHIWLLLGGGFDCKLAKVLSMEWKINTRNRGWYIIAIRESRDWNCRPSSTSCPTYQNTNVFLVTNWASHHLQTKRSEMAELTDGRDRNFPCLGNFICWPGVEKSHHGIVKYDVVEHPERTRDGRLSASFGHENTICSRREDYSIVWWMAKSQKCSGGSHGDTVFWECPERKGGIWICAWDEQESLQGGEAKRADSAEGEVINEKLHG